MRDADDIILIANLEAANELLSKAMDISNAQMERAIDALEKGKRAMDKACNRIEQLEKALEETGKWHKN